MHHMLNYGFSGKIYPINPRQNEIMGIKAYPSLEEVPGMIDYVIYLMKLTLYSMSCGSHWLLKDSYSGYHDQSIYGILFLKEDYYWVST